MRQTLRREPSISDQAHFLAVAEDEVREILGLHYQAASLDGSQELGLGPQLATRRDPYDDVDTREALRAALQTLSPRERRILHLRFVEELKQREIGTILGVSQMQVSRMLSTSLAHLRDHLLSDAA